MAEKNWITVQPSLEPILRPINAVIAAIDSVLAFLIAILNVVQSILNIIKAFLLGLINPLRAIIEAIIAEIRQIISDLRQAGLYLSSDLDQFEVQPVNRLQELSGGYAAYERRMLVRLLDRSDPTRPNFSSSTAVVALFLYISSGDLFALIALIKRVMAFFGKRSGVGYAPFPAPTTPTAVLGDIGQRPAFFKPPSALTGPPDAVLISWTMPSTGSAFAQAPKGFLVHVSTTPDGFGLRAIKKNMLNSSDVRDVGMLVQAGVDPATGGELRLYGGLSDIAFGGDVLSLPLTSGDGAGTEEDQANRLYFALDQNTPLLPPATLSQSGVPAGAATYYFTQPLSGLLGGAASYSCTLRVQDLPEQIVVETVNGEVVVSTEPADTYYIRVRPVTNDFVSARGFSGRPADPMVVPAGSLYTVTPSLVESTQGIVLRPETDQTQYGNPSEPVIVNVPSADQVAYINAVKTALAILILVRPDLVPVAVDSTTGGMSPANNTYMPGFDTGLEGLKDTFVQLWGQQSYEDARFDTFARQVLAAVDAYASQLLLSYMPSDALLSAVADQVQLLNNFKWSDINPKWPDYTILDSLRQSNAYAGVAGNPKSFAPGSSGETRLRKAPSDPNLWLSRVGFPVRQGQTTTPFIVGAGWSDYCPVVYSYPGDLYIDFARNLLQGHNDGEVLNAASMVLTLSTVTRTNLPAGRWEAHRFLYDVLQPVDVLLTDVEQFLLAILDGLKGIIDKIVAYIEAIQARIYQLQALINQIRALLASLTLFDLPSFSGLLLVENGTDGIAASLMTAGNKPTDGPNAVSAGAVVLFGGLPSVFLELIALILAGGGEE